MQRHKQGGEAGKLIVLFFVLGLLGLGYAIWAGLRVGAEPDVVVTSDLPAIGPKTTITVAVTEKKRGLSTLRVELLGLGEPKVLAEQTFTPQPAFKPWAPKTDTHTLQLVLGKESMPELKPGEVTVRVVVGRASTWLRSPDPLEKQLTLPVRLVPPTLMPQSQFVHVRQGGAEVIVYEVGETSVQDGVQAGAWFFPGYPLPGGPKQQHFAFFGVPYDMDDASSVKLVATDALGNRAEASFVQEFFPKKLGADTIELSEKFMQKVVTEIYAQTPELVRKGDLLQDYLQLNRDLRRKNSQELVELAKKTEQKFLWEKTFQPFGNASVMGHFADRRAYMFQGKQVDTQDHLGFDLAALTNSPVNAANAGVVVLSRYFGIFGNCIVVDHGYGLMSLYAHLSSFGVKEGDHVERGQIVGKTGATGLAGGDHLHFTMLLHGLPTSAVEWWDGHWIKDRLKLKLGEALPFKDG